jgi:hypothetical protein
VNERKLQHCGKYPGLMCERFSRFKDPDINEEVAKGCSAPDGTGTTGEEIAWY